MTSSKPKKGLWIFCPEMTLAQFPKSPRQGLKFKDFKRSAYNFTTYDLFIDRFLILIRMKDHNGMKLVLEIIDLLWIFSEEENWHYNIDT